MATVHVSDDEGTSLEQTSGNPMGSKLMARPLRSVVPTGVGYGRDKFPRVSALLSMAVEVDVGEGHIL